jgi:hypothetical protein
MNNIRFRVRKAAGEVVQGDLWPADAAAAKARRNGCCADCGVNTLAADEWYIVKDDVWQAASRLGDVTVSFFLCIGCIEQRLGRRLTPGDFDDVPINVPNKFSMSRRLRDRLTGGKT